MSTDTQQQFLISFESPRLGYGKVQLSNPHFLGIPEGVTVIAGDNGSGKTTLATILEKGRYAYGNRLRFLNEKMRVKMLSFTDIHSLSGMEVQYMAQRMEASMNDYVPTVSDILGKKAESPRWKTLCDTLSLKDILDKKVNFLSSGELRKLLIINALLDDPDILILDNPYIGLDVASRAEFDETMKSLRNNGKGIVLSICDLSDIPDYTDSVLLMKNKVIETLLTDKGEIETLKNTQNASATPEVSLPTRPDSKILSYDVAFAIRDGHIRYGDRQIFKNVNWVIKRGECWALAGKNGSGKSLLLSMICADNPQGYANDITLFDRKRGSGESIWEIKDAIGYVSPEMQLFFKSGSSVREIVMQGLRNSLERYRPTTQMELELADKWLEILGISHLAERKFTDLSSGEQRLVLVGRAMIKQPELLVLDEPLHGLDKDNKQRINVLVDQMMRRNGTSLIYVSHYDSEIPDCVTNIHTLIRS